MLLDAHCDILTKVCDDGISLFRNNEHFCFERTNGFGSYVQVMAAWLEPNCPTPFQRAVEKIDAFYRANDGRIHLLTDFEKPLEELKESYYGVLSIEDGEAIEGSLEKLEYLYAKGVRMFGMTWNGRNALADGVGVENAQGLTAIGKKTVEKANALGIVLDLSHIAPKGFWEVLDLTTKPIVCSHSNSYQVCSHPRNLTDEQFKAIIENNGCVGLNWYPLFLQKDEKSGIQNIMQHLEYFLSLGGENHVGFGADMDGFKTLPEGFTGVESYQMIIEEMEKRNYPSTLIEKICAKNFWRVFQTAT